MGNYRPTMTHYTTMDFIKCYELLVGIYVHRKTECKCTGLSLGRKDCIGV